MKKIALSVFLCLVMTQDLQASYCYLNQKQDKNIMPNRICFTKIGGKIQDDKSLKVFLKNDTIQSWYAPKRYDVESPYNQVVLVGDYLNYVEDCGLNILSQFKWVGNFDAHAEFIDFETSRLTINFEWTPDSCHIQKKKGSEIFIPEKAQGTGF